MIAAALNMHNYIQRKMNRFTEQRAILYKRNGFRRVYTKEIPPPLMDLNICNCTYSFHPKLRQTKKNHGRNKNGQ